MRKIIILALMAISTVSYSQKEIAWFDAAIKIMYGSSNIINNAVIDDPNLNYELGFGSALGFGGKFGINRGYNGLAIEVMYTSNGHTLEGLNDYPAAPKIEWSNLDLYFLFRNAANLGWFEIGPKVSFVQSMNRTDADGQVTEFADYNSRLISGVLGFGVNLIGTDGAFSGQIGLRFEYGFSDLNGQETLGAGAEPFPFASNLYADGYEKSIPIYAGLVFELNWGLGYYGIAQCGSRAKFFKT